MRWKLQYDNTSKVLLYNAMNCFSFRLNNIILPRASAEKFSRGERGGATEIKNENSIIKHLSIPCVKIQGGRVTSPVDANVYSLIRKTQTVS